MRLVAPDQKEEGGGKMEWDWGEKGRKGEKRKRKERRGGGR
jgi:hypothetical protein